MDFKEFLNMFGPANDNTHDGNMERAVLTHAACQLMASDKELTPREAVEKVLKTCHQVYEVVEESR